MESTQGRLLEAAADLFAEHGFEGVSMRQIAREMDMTQAAIYHHFPTKSDLYIAAVRHVYSGRTEALVSQISTETNPATQLTLLVHNLMQVFEEQPQFRRIYFRELLAGDRERLQMMVRKVFAEIHDLLDTLLAELAPHMDSHLMGLSLAGLILHHLEARKLSELMDEGGPEHQDLDKLAEHVTTLLLHGVGRP